jgi:hypothetical protein
VLVKFTVQRVYRLDLERPWGKRHEPKLGTSQPARLLLRNFGDRLDFLRPRYIARAICDR